MRFFSSKSLHCPRSTYFKKLVYPEAAKQEFLHKAHELSRLHHPYFDYKKFSSVVQETMHSSLLKHNGHPLLKTFEEIRNKKNFGVIQVENFPVDPVENLHPRPLPISIFKSSREARLNIGKTGFCSEYALLALNACCGLGIKTYPSLQEGAFVQHIFIRDNKRNTASHAGAINFPLHLDGTHNREGEMIKLVSLLTLRNYETKTRLAPLYPLEEILKKELQGNFEIVTKPYFNFLSSAAYDVTHSIRAPLAYLDKNGHIKKWRIQGNKNLMKADQDNELAKKALNLVFTFIDNPPVVLEIILQHGELLMIDNEFILHGRTSIPNLDANRHLLRTHGY